METEQEKQDSFLEKLGAEKADRIQYIWKNSFPHQTPWSNKTKEQVFRAAARKAGFTWQEIHLFLGL